MKEDTDLNIDTIEDIENIDDVSFEPEDGEGNNESLESKLKKLRTLLKETEKEKTEYLTGWQRAKADYVNLKQEEEKKRMELKHILVMGIVDDLLTVLDSFDMAFKNKEAWEKVDPTWRSGIEYIYKEFVRVLESHGVSKIDTIGAPFDPNLHQAIENIETDDHAKDHTVAEVIQSGYTLEGRTIRPARVKVYGHKE
jgi:molecular chaperone GrpE